MTVRRHRALVSAGVLWLLACAGAIAGEAERAAAENAMNTLYESERYAEALDACQLLIEYTRDEFGEKSPELVDPLISYGHIQRQLHHPERAIESYDRAALLIEMNESVFSDRLVGLLRSIGGAYQESQKIEESAAALQRAKVITHRNYGIMNLQQLPILDDLTEVYASHDLLAANREQIFAMRVNERRFGPDSPDVVPGIFHLADWYKRTRQFSAARSLYRRAVTILETAYGPSDVRLVPALTGIAETYRAERSFRGEGRESLVRALQTYDAAEYPDAADQATVLIKLGDWYLLTNEREEAVDSYTRAWQVLSQEGGAEIAQKQLGKPTRLRYDDPPPEVDTAVAAAREPLFVEVLFTVKPDGTVDDAVVTESNASNSVKRQVRLAVQQARYRPGFEDGKPVPMQVRIRQKYYSQEAVAARTEKAPQEPAASIPSEASTPGEAGAATDTGEGVPAGGAAPADGGATGSPGEGQDSNPAGTTGAEAPREPTAPAEEPEPETP